MTFTDVPPALCVHSTDSDLLASRRRNTIGSPTSAVFKPGAAYTPSVKPAGFIPLLSPGVETAEAAIQVNGTSAPKRPAQRSSRSPSPKSLSPHRRRLSSRSPERLQQEVRETTTSYLTNGRSSCVQNRLAPKSGPSNMLGGKRHDVPQQTMTPPTRPGFRTHRSSQSNLSASLPSTPHHLPLVSNGASRSPSPPTCLLDSPRSAASEPVSTSPYQRAPHMNMMGCGYETALVNARRRMPYSLGFDRLPREKPRLEKLSWADEEKLTHEMEEAFQRLKPSDESNKRRKLFLQKLDRILNEEWPGHDTQVHAFGSTENHLCMNDSDVDVCITTRCKDIEATCRLAAVLAQRGMERVICVPGAKVPIVKIWDPELRVACDMNVNNTLALDNTRMIKTYVEIDPRVRPLALIIKHWTKERQLNDAATGGTLSSYTWICMILNFLQLRDPPILPSLHNRPHKPKWNAGVDVSFDDDIASLQGWGHANKETLGGLLFAFFKKYGHDLDYEKSVISVREGKILSKEEKQWQYLQNNRLCVEEPFNTSRNLGNTADDSSMRGIHMEFRRAHRILCETASLSQVCEHYEFPPEEHHHHHIVPPVSRPVTLTRSNSNHRPYNKYGHPRGGRSFQQSHRGNFGNRRASSGAYHQNGMQNNYGYNQGIYGDYVPSAHEQQLLLQLQQQTAQHQLLQAQAQLHMNQQKQGNGHVPPVGPSSTTSSNQDHFNYNQWQSIPYLNQLYQHQYNVNNLLAYQLSMATDGTGLPNSPPRTPGLLNDQRQDSNRLGPGRSRRTNGPYSSSGSRSHSQPPSIYQNGGYTRSIPIVGVTSSEDEDFGDHSSNGNPPETPPEETYIGYYTIGGTLQSDVAVLDPQIEDDEEPFLDQKNLVDRQKRFSSEKLPPPMLESRDASPTRIPVVEQVLSCPAVALPLLANGATPLPTGVVNDVLMDSPKDTVNTRRQVFQQKLAEVNRNQIHQHETNTARTLPVMIAESITTTETSEDGENISPKQSPTTRQKAAAGKIVWPNSRAAEAARAEALKAEKEKIEKEKKDKEEATSAAALSTPVKLATVPETSAPAATPTPSTPTRHRNNKKDDTSSSKPSTPRTPSTAAKKASSKQSNTTSSDLAPSTPAPATADKPASSNNNHHHGRKGKSGGAYRHAHNNSKGAGGSNGNSDSSKGSEGKNSGGNSVAGSGTGSGSGGGHGGWKKAKNGKGRGGRRPGNGSGSGNGSRGEEKGKGGDGVVGGEERKGG